MNDREQDQLLSELFADDDLATLRSRSLTGARTAMQLTARRRRRMKLAVATVLPLMAAVMLVHDQGARRAEQPSPQASSPLAHHPDEDAGVPLISDTELLALFPDRPVALMGHPGRQQLVFLDAAAPKARKAGEL